MNNKKIQNGIDDKKAFYFQWHFTEQCNLRCIHCYQDNYAINDLPEEKIYLIAHIINSTLKKWNKFGRISLTGGEPFLRKNILNKLLDYFENADQVYWIGILSNGTLIDEEDAIRLQNYSKLKEVQISIDGANAESHDRIRGIGNFSKAVKAIQVLKQNDIPVSIMFTLHRENCTEALPVIKLAEDLNVNALTIERIVPMNTDDVRKFYMYSKELEAQYKQIYQLKKQIEAHSTLKIRVSRPLWVLTDENLGGFCPAGFSSLAILYDGTVLPCRRLGIPIGNILTDGLFKIWYTSDVLWNLRNKRNLGEDCRNCQYLSRCGGCRAVAYQITGDYMADDPQCWKVTERLQ